MPERFTVRVTKDYLVFCSGHFITYHGDECERLHGHNYRVAAEVEAPLDANHYVFDFIALKNIMRALTDELDHFMLVPTRNELIAVAEDGDQIRLRFRDKEWVFPREDCALLPIENTTAELLSRYIAGKLGAALKAHNRFTPEVIRVEVEE